MSHHRSICTICLDPLLRPNGQVGAIVPCGHCFHEPCLRPWAAEKLSDKETKTVQCPLCNATITNFVRLYLSTSTSNHRKARVEKKRLVDNGKAEQTEGASSDDVEEGKEDSKENHSPTDDNSTGQDEVDDELLDEATFVGFELEAWRKEYDTEQKSQRMKAHSTLLQRNINMMDDLLEKQRVLERYQDDVSELKKTKEANAGLKRQLFKQIMASEKAVRERAACEEKLDKLQQDQLEIQEHCELVQDENLELKKELLRQIMMQQSEREKAEQLQYSIVGLKSTHENFLTEIQTLREKNAYLEEELVQANQTHMADQREMESHQQVLCNVMAKVDQEQKQTELIQEENLAMREEMLQLLLQQQEDAENLAKAGEFLQQFENLDLEYQRSKAELRLVLMEKYQMGLRLQAWQDRFDALQQQQQQQPISQQRQETNSMQEHLQTSQVGRRFSLFSGGGLALTTPTFHCI